MTCLVEIASDVIFYNNANIELGLVASMPVKVHQVYHDKQVKDIADALECLNNIKDIMDEEDLDVHDKNAYVEETLSKLIRGVKWEEFY